MTAWIEWKGGECPVDLDCEVTAKLRNGVETTWTGRTFDWRHLPNDASQDITAYRVRP